MRDSRSGQAKPQATPLDRGQSWQEARSAGFSDPQRFASQAQALGTGAASVVPQHLLFALGTVTCALPASVVQGVERIPEVTPVPNTAAWVLGVVQVWGAIVSVVDLAAFAGLPALPRSSHNRLLVVNSPAMSVGFLVEAMVEMRALGENLAGRLDPRGVPEELRPYAVGALTDAGNTLIVLDPARLLASEKLQRYQVV